MTAAIEHLAPAVVGKDPRAYEAVVALMYALRRQATGGMVQQAIGAIENALLDIKAKALGMPVYELFGGPVRERIRLYWSHCGTYRLSWAEAMQIPPLRTLDDVVAPAGKWSPRATPRSRPTCSCSTTSRACTRPASPAATTSPS